MSRRGELVKILREMIATDLRPEQVASDLLFDPLKPEELCALLNVYECIDQTLDDLIYSSLTLIEANDAIGEEELYYDFVDHEYDRLVDAKLEREAEADAAANATTEED